MNLKEFAKLRKEGKLLKVNEAAELLNLSSSYTRQKLYDGSITGFKLRGRWLVYRDSLKIKP
jgi:excisionase family DNA binding protein